MLVPYRESEMTGDAVSVSVITPVKEASAEFEGTADAVKKGLCDEVVDAETELRMLLDGVCETT